MQRLLNLITNNYTIKLLQTKSIIQTNKTIIMKTKIFLMAFIACVGLSTSSFAQSKFAATHPRRAEVNARLKNQDKRIHTEVKDGEISKAKAAELHARDHSIRATERYDASKDGGHVTKAEQEKLNKRENNVSKAIGK